MPARLEDVIDPAKHRVRMIPGFAAAGGMVSIGGLVQPAIWLRHVTAVEGDPVQVLLVDRPDAPSTALVLGETGAMPPQPREGTVQTAPMGSETVTVATDSGPISATFLASYIPAVSDRVRLLWSNGEATVLGKVGVTPVREVKKKAEPTPPPPSKAGDGGDTFTASDSGTYSTAFNAWNSYYGKDVYQGSYPSSGANRGAWFYHGKPSKLAGKKATGVQFWMPRRARAGAFNSSVQVTLYLHGSKKRPSGDVNRGASHTVTVPANFKGGWIDLPASWGDDLIGGDGIGIAGGAYAAFEGVAKSAKSGQIRISWEG